MNLWLDFAHTQPLVIGHRGASAHSPENTLAAFQLALDQGADAIEFDIKRCASGEVVIMHDASVDRTTNGAGLTHQLSLAQLRALDAGGGQPVPTLSEVFETLGAATTQSGRPFLFNVEVTNYPTPRDGLESTVVELIKRHNIAERVMFSSFNPLSLRTLAKLAPGIPRGMLYSSDMPIHLRRAWLAPFVPHQFRHPEKDMVSPEAVREFKAKGLRVNAWTVNAEADIQRMIDCGVNGIIGDSPETMRRHVGGKR